MTLTVARKACPGWKIFRAEWGPPYYQYKAVRRWASRLDSWYDTIQVDFTRPSQASIALEKLVAMVGAVITAEAAPAWPEEGDP